MRKNLPVTDTERTFGEETKLISATDLRGKIRYCNDAFVDVSGFSRDELIGQPHNIVRHPDMPSEVYEIMWSHLKAGKPWMGLVKNRCKNGDYYWVSAYITPITENGEVVGYESVRSCPSKAQKTRAGTVYRRINGGKKPGGLWKRVSFTWLFVVITCLTSGVAFVLEHQSLAFGMLMVALVHIPAHHEHPFRTNVNTYSGST